MEAEGIEATANRTRLREDGIGLLRDRSGTLRILIAIWFVSLSLLSVQQEAIAADPAAAEVSNRSSPRAIAAVGLDLVVARPLALIRCAVGAVAFVPVGLVLLPTGRERFGEAYRVFVEDPWHYALTRRLGDI